MPISISGLYFTHFTFKEVFECLFGHLWHKYSNKWVTTQVSLLIINHKVTQEEKRSSAGQNSAAILKCYFYFHHLSCLIKILIHVCVCLYISAGVFVFVVCVTHSSVVSLGMPLGRECSPLLLHRTTLSEHVQTSGQPDAGRHPLSSAPGQRGRRDKDREIQKLTETTEAEKNSKE